MRKLAAEAIEVGALGFASSRLTLHKSESGQPIPSFEAGQAEIEAIARGVKDAGGGLIQFVPDLVAGDYGPALQTVFDVADDVGLPVTFTLAIGNAGDPFFVDGLNMVEKANAAGGDITAQVFPRPIGLVIGLELSGNPFVMYPSYREIADLPLAERVAEMRKPEVRERILADTPVRRGPSADVRRPGIRVDVPTGRPAELRAPAFGEHRQPRQGPRGQPAGGGLRPAARRRRARHAAHHARQLPRWFAGHRGRADPPRRRGARPRRRRRPLRNDLRRKLSDVHARALGTRPRHGAALGGRGGPRADVGTRPRRRAGRPRPHRRRLQGRPQRHRPLRR